MRARWPLIFALCLASWLALVAPALHARPVKTEHVTAELVAERSAVPPGGSLQISDARRRTIASPNPKPCSASRARLAI